MSPTAEAAPTPRQLRYLRVLAGNTGTTFTYPATRGEASRQIDRLRKLEDEPHAPYVETGDSNAEDLVYATAVRGEEVSGFGSSATWRAASPPARSAPLQTRVGRLTELARYTVSCGQRVLYGQRVNGGVRITDRPVSGPGRSYVVEREVELDGYAALRALLVDYVEQARELDDIPMASGAVRQMLGKAGPDA